MVLVMYVIFAAGAESALADVKIGGTVTVHAGDTVKNAVSFGHDVIVYGTVLENAVSIGGNVIVETGGDIKGDAVSIGGDLELKKGTSVGGDAVTIFGCLIKDYDTNIGGETVSVFDSMSDRPSRRRDNQNFGDKLIKLFILGPAGSAFGFIGMVIIMIFSFFKLLFLMVVAALVTHFFPEQVINMADSCKRSFWKALLLGFLVVVLIPLLVVSFIITLIGIPLVPLLIVSLILTNLYGTVGVSLWAGRLLPNDGNRSLMANVTLGVLVIWLAKLIPVINIFVKIGTGFLAFGTVIIAHFAERRGV